MTVGRSFIPDFFRAFLPSFLSHFAGLVRFDIKAFLLHKYKSKAYYWPLSTIILYSACDSPTATILVCLFSVNKYENTNIILSLIFFAT